jgi:hypothetical protein
VVEGLDEVVLAAFEVPVLAVAVVLVVVGGATANKQKRREGKKVKTK